MVPIEFLERLNSQNKAIWKNQIKQEKKLDEIDKVLKKIHREDTLAPTFFEVSIKFYGFKHSGHAYITLQITYRSYIYIYDNWI